mmetsp:Transcript_71817/g.221814  ORF Transcript_71817/g.221814 Transcript_71817/m.221814 type:complete len:339 (+) Transcript_71817:63-1079(+)
MPLRVVSAALAAAVARAAELHCVGRAAHEVLVSAREGDWLAVQPAPARDVECAKWGWPGTGGDRQLCVGANHDETCAAAKEPTIALPFGARCQGCFVGAATDVFYSLNISRFHLEHVGIGFRGTELRSTVEIEADKARIIRKHKGSKTFGEEPLEFKLKVGRFELDLKIGMPTELYYEVQARGGVHTDIGAILDVHMGDNYVEYNKGQGWSQKKEKARFSVKSTREADDNVAINATLGFRSALQAEIGKVAWFHLNVANEMPLGITSVGASGSDLVHSCLDLGLKLDVAHEADVDFSLFREHFSRHWGPTTDRHHDGAVFHKCDDLHPPRAQGMTLVI